MLLVLGALSLVSAAQVHQFSGATAGTGARELSPELAPAPPRSGLRLLASTPYLRDLAALVLLGTMGAVLVDYAFKAHAVARFGRGEDLLRFFAMYYVAINVMTFIIQTSSNRMVLERFGLTVATASPSAAVMLGSIGALLVPGLPSAMAARSGQAILRGSIFRSGYEVFYTPVASADKRAAKSVIDVGFDKLGDAAGASLIRLVQWLAFAGQLSAVLGAAIVCSALALIVSSRLRRGYVQSLEASLRNRAVELDLTQVHDTLTRTIALRVRQPRISGRRGIRLQDPAESLDVAHAVAAVQDLAGSGVHQHVVLLRQAGRDDGDLPRKTTAARHREDDQPGLWCGLE